MAFYENKGIISKVMGGLGNQIFINVAAYIAHKIHKCPLYIFKNPISNNNHNLNNFDYNNSIFKYLGNIVNYEIDDILLRFIIDYGYSFHNHSHNDGFKKWTPETMIPGTITSSYYQYYPTIKPYESEIRNILLKGLEEHHNKYVISNPDSTAFLHIRRGDYLNHPDVHYIQPLEYYQSAISILLSKKEINKIYVFSDDVQWIKNASLFQNELFEIFDSNDELYTLHLMSQCKGGAICANSTFSWWGAFLGAYSQRNPVFVPSRWISIQTESLFPEEWIVI